MGEKSQSTNVTHTMSHEELPSIEEFTEDFSKLPSVDDFLTEGALKELPSVEDFIEKEQEVLVEATQTIEDAEGNSFAEIKDIIPPFPELIRLINDVRRDIPDIPEIKYYDKELEDLTEQINRVREEIPEVRYYEAEIEAICDQIDLVKQVVEKNAADIPEIKYYDEQISELEHRLDLVSQNITELPEPRYYEEDLESIKVTIQEVQNQIPTFPKWVNEVNEVPDFSWIGKTFSVIDDDFVKVHDAVEGLRGKVEYDLDQLAEHFDKKEFETRTEFNELRESINSRFDTEKEKIWKEIKETSMRMWGHHKEFKDDDRKLRKQLLGEYNTLKQTLKKDLKEINQESVKTDELLLGYFNDLKKEISELPEVKYYDEQIDDVRSELKEGFKSLKILVEEIRQKQEVLKEEVNNRPIQPDPSESNIDPLTPTDQNFATHEDLAKHYKLFVNRIQQQLYTIGGGGAGFIKDLDDVEFDQTTGTGKLLIYDGSQWVGIASTAISGSQNLNEVLGGGNTSSLGMSVGVVTATKLHVGSGTTFTEDLVVTGDARVTGILTIGTATITLDPNTNIVRVGSGITLDASNNIISVGGYNIADSSGNANYAGIVTALSIDATSATFSGNVSVAGTLTYDDVTYLDSIGIATARSGLEIGSGSITTIVSLGAATATTTTTDQSNIDTFDASVFRSAQYQIQITQDSSYHVTTLNVLHDGSTVYLSEFGTIKTGSSLATFDADIDSGNVRVRATPSSTSSTVFKISKTLTKV